MFKKAPLANYFDKKINDWKQEIERLELRELETENLVTKLVAKHKISDVPTLQKGTFKPEDNPKCVSSGRKSEFGRELTTYWWTYRIPYTGNGDLFQYTPSKLPHNFPHRPSYAIISRNHISFDIDSAVNSTEPTAEVLSNMMAELKEDYQTVENALEFMKNDCDNYNSDLESSIKNQIDREIARLKGLNNTRDNLSVTF